jgi:hypothetical protein
MLTIESLTKQKEPIMENNQDNAIREAHFKEQMEAASDVANTSHSQLMDVLEDLEYESVNKVRTKADLVNGYLLEEWTWLTNLQEKYDNEEDIPAPKHCIHVDPMNPTVWVGRLAQPNVLLCMDCALEEGQKDVATGLELCDRCHTTNESGEFYEFVMPIVNIQMMGSICESCMSKV